MHALYIFQRKFLLLKVFYMVPKTLSLCKPRSSTLSYHPLMRDTDILTQVIRLGPLAHLLCCSILCNTLDCSLPGSFVHGIFQASILEWVAISGFPGIEPTSPVSPAIAGRLFTTEPLGKLPPSPRHMCINT